MVRDAYRFCGGSGGRSSRKAIRIERSATVGTFAVRDRPPAVFAKRRRATADAAAYRAVKHGDGGGDQRPVAIQVDSVTHAFRTPRGSLTVLKDVNLTARQGEFVSIVGPSGCGKSTILSIIAGLIPPTHGSVHIFGSPVVGISNQLGFVFQRDALLPWRTALQNVALPLRFRGASRRQADVVARDWLNRVGLSSFEATYPNQLSGGMRKRVAVAATLAYEPQIVLMDEPFSALDVQNRDLMENDLLKLWQESKQTVIFITHDLEEAIGLSDRVVVMTAAPGRILSEYDVTLGRPRDLLEIKGEPEFAQTYRLIWQDLRAEVLKASGRSE